MPIQSMILRAALLALLAARAVAAPVSLLPAQAGDLQPTVLAVPAESPVENAMAAAMPPLAHEPVQFSWAMHGRVEPVQPYLARSQESYFEATADQLAAGVTLHTTAPRALVHLQPLAAPGPRAALAIHPASLTLQAHGKAYANGDGMEMLVSADRLNKAELPFAPGSSAFRIAPTLGAGAITLQAPGLAGSERYLVQLVEPDSPIALTMRTDAPHYLAGRPIRVNATLQDGAAGHFATPARIDGALVSPSGRRYPLTFRPGANGSMSALANVPREAGLQPGLWEAQASTSATVRGLQVERTIRVAFAAAPALARLTREARLDAAPAGAALRFGVQAAQPGRYEIRALLYGTVDGQLALLGAADAAQWLEAGDGSVTLSLPATLLAGASGPFEVRDLQLLEQGHLAVLQRQQRALVFDETDLPRAMAAAASASASPPVPAHAKQPPSLTER